MEEPEINPWVSNRTSSVPVENLVFRIMRIMFKAKQSCREGNLSEEEEGRGKKPPNSVYNR
jgi:hypothetical protein